MWGPGSNEGSGALLGQYACAARDERAKFTLCLCSIRPAPRAQKADNVEAEELGFGIMSTAAATGPPQPPEDTFSETDGSEKAHDDVAADVEEDECLDEDEPDLDEQDDAGGIGGGWRY